MKRPSLYSRSSAPRRLTPAAVEAAGARAAPRAAPAAEAARPPATTTAAPASRRSRWWTRSQKPLLFAGGALAALALAYLHASWQPTSRQLTQRDIDKAVLHTLATKQIPSRAARAAENVRRSVVRVRGLAPNKEGKLVEEGVGSGVVIIDSGVILTNLHVVMQAKVLKVVFADGLESEATVLHFDRANDLAVLRARIVPDDLVAATLRSTSDLAPGDEVVAVGFPFGIGPSVSAGVVSGLKREFRSPKDERVLTNLIQFDAAANPGSSGGPLVTMDGEVVGIVTAILNPTEQRVFIGIGFAVPIENAAQGVGMHPF
jgi:S1-C subfamily serine protease